jgi:hypothetical protein
MQRALVPEDLFTDTERALDGFGPDRSRHGPR